MQRYAPISKMEAQSDGTIKVWGIASTEAEDHDGEVVKSDAMKEALPDYMAFGAIREMHQNIAAGTCLEAAVNDDGCTVICAHVVDPVSVKKVQTGVLKGFSIGGMATATDPLNKKIITGLTLNEISLVDKPANPEALISLWKSEKTMTHQHNHAAEAAVTGEALGNEIEAAISMGATSLPELMKSVKALVKKHKIDKEVECAHGTELGEKCNSCDGGYAMTKDADDMDEFCKADYSDEERATMAASGEAESDGSYPIKNEKDLENAIHAFGRSKNKPKTKAHIKARAKALGLENKLPEKWKDGNESGSPENKVAGAVAPAGGSNEPAGDEGKTAKAAASGKGEGAVQKTQPNAEVTPVGPSTQGAPNADNMQPPAGVTNLENQAAITMLEKPVIGDLVTIKWGEDEVAGEITELGDGGSATVTNGDALLAVDSSKLTHHEMVGTKRNWVIDVANTADFLAAKPGNDGGKGSSKAATVSEQVEGALLKVLEGGKGRPIQKGMWTVSDWASSLQGLIWLYKDVQWEGTSEEDPKDAEVAKKIALWIKDGAAIWLEYAKDELGEMLSGIADPDNMAEFVIALAAKSEPLEKALKGDTGVGFAIAKALGNVDMAATIEKAVASAVSKAVAPLQAENAELQKRVKELAEMPLPVQGRMNGMAVNKGVDSSEAEENKVQPVRKNGVVDDAATEFKKAFQNPQQMVRIVHNK